MTEPTSDPVPDLRSDSVVAVLGAGAVGGTLAAALHAAGWEVTLGVGNPGDGRREVHGVALPAVSAAAAVAQADVVIAATPGSVTAQLFRDLAGSLDGLVVLDATNNTTPGARRSALPVLAEVAPAALGYRAFNSVGWENFTDPDSDMFFAGPEARRADVEALIGAIGPRPVWVGADVRAHQAVDDLTGLWFALVMGRGLDRHTAFKLVGRHGAGTPVDPVPNP